jgi:hypothetical protein
MGLLKRLLGREEPEAPANPFGEGAAMPPPITVEASPHPAPEAAPAPPRSTTTPPAAGSVTVQTANGPFEVDLRQLPEASRRIADAQRGHAGDPRALEETVRKILHAYGVRPPP